MQPVFLFRSALPSLGGVVGRVAVASLGWLRHRYYEDARTLSKFHVDRCSIPSFVGIL